MLKRRILAYILCLATLGIADAETLTIAAASDMTYCLPELVKSFQQSVPTDEVKTVFGASGSLYAQINNGAPYDVFMSADMRYPQELVQSGNAESASMTRYARGHLVLWTNSASIPFTHGMADLEVGGTQRIALANPETAPYGRAAKAALQQARLWDKLQPRLVFGENIAQTLQYAETGNAEIAFLSRSLIHSPKMAGKGRYQEVPEMLYPPIDQGLVITRIGKDKPLATKFAIFMQSKAAKSVLQSHGFAIPDQQNK